MNMKKFLEELEILVNIAKSVIQKMLDRGII